MCLSSPLFLLPFLSITSSWGMFWCWKDQLLVRFLLSWSPHQSFPVSFLFLPLYMEHCSCNKFKSNQINSKYIWTHITDSSNFWRTTGIFIMSVTYQNNFIIFMSSKYSNTGWYLFSCRYQVDYWPRGIHPNK